MGGAARVTEPGIAWYSLGREACNKPRAQGPDTRRTHLRHLVFMAPGSHGLPKQHPASELLRALRMLGCAMGLCRLIRETTTTVVRSIPPPRQLRPARFSRGLRPAYALIVCVFVAGQSRRSGAKDESGAKSNLRLAEHYRISIYQSSRVGSLACIS